MKPLLRALFVAAGLALVTVAVQADSPYPTWAPGPGGHWYQTQAAYAPVAEIDLPIKGAEDMDLAPDGFLYIADTGKGRILKLKDFQIVESFDGGVLKSPTGIFVDTDGVMYVADAELNQVVILAPDGSLLKQFGRPTEPLFGKSREFLPRKIAVDARKNVFIVSEGSVDGVVQMNTNGNFIGYFGANSASMSLKMILQRMFLTQEQLDQLVKNQAASPSNLAFDPRGLLFTVSAGATGGNGVRRYTIAGKNIFPSIWGDANFRDIDVSPDGLVLLVEADGWIDEMDLNGTLLFVFKAKDNGDQRLGTLASPTAIERDQNRIYVLDKEKNAIAVYDTTAFAQQVHAGVRLYTEGFYQAAKPFFEQVLNYNGSFVMAYQGIADAYYKVGDYGHALTAYRYAEDRAGYSQAFWELRNVLLQQYLGTALMVLLGVWLGGQVVTRLERRYRWFDPARGWLTALQRYRLVDDVVFMFRFIRQPLDSFYYIKKNLRGSLGFALVMYAWVVVARILSLYWTAFVFNPHGSFADIRVENEILYTLFVLVLWNAANYLVSTISDGEGRIRDVVIGTAYSLFPYALLIMPITLLSNVLSLNETFLFSFSTNLMWAWTGVMLFAMVQEIHNYTFSETVRNVLVTLFTMGLFLLTGYILYVLFNQLFEFISAVIQEVGLRG